jgi:hypothetical protein
MGLNIYTTLLVEKNRENVHNKGKCRGMGQNEGIMSFVYMGYQ